MPTTRKTKKPARRAPKRKVEALTAREITKRFAAYSAAMFAGDFIRAKELAGTFSLRPE